jgi:hypothetical protein
MAGHTAPPSQCPPPFSCRFPFSFPPSCLQCASAHPRAASPPLPKQPPPSELHHQQWSSATDPSPTALVAPLPSHLHL